MPPRKKIPQPIDRPLSKAYLRGFSGWSTAYPPGASDPASVRVMDNVWVDRNGALAVRPGLRCLSYSLGPDSPILPSSIGIGLQGLEMVGSMELFYVADGSRAMLFAVREEDGTVGFRALLMSGDWRSVYGLEEDEIGFRIPDGAESLNFSADTKYVKYLQINNKVLALSDAGEPARYFDVGERKVAKALTTLSVPEWTADNKLTVWHPDANWILDHNGYYEMFNGIENPAFEGGYYGWSVDDDCEMQLVDGELRIGSKPRRINAVPNPLHDMSNIGGWVPNAEYPATISAAVNFLKIVAPGPGRYIGQTNKFSFGIKPFERYKIAFSPDTSGSTAPELLVDFYTIDGARIENTLRIPIPENSSTRFVSDSIQVPDGTVAMRIGFGGTAIEAGDSVWVCDVMVCQEDESTTIFDGNSTGPYEWVDTPFNSASVYHPATSVVLTSNKAAITKDANLYTSIDVRSDSASTHNVSIRGKTFSASGVEGAYESSSTSFTPGMSARVTVTDTTCPYPLAALRLSIALLGRGEYFYVKNAALVSSLLADPGYFDGSMADTSSLLYTWEDELRPHASRSRRAYLWSTTPTLVPQAPSATSLIKTGGSAANPYKMAFFYTFENETGESTPSQITEVRMQRPWSNWYWEEPDLSGGPSGTQTVDPFMACDQLAALIPIAVYNQAVDEGALKWNLYAMSWSDQAPVPVEADLVGTGVIRSSPDADPAPAVTGRVLVITPRKLVTSFSLNLPTRENRTNYSEAPRHRNGLVAGERMILVGNPANPASIQWTSNFPADSMNFTPTKGGGIKTLTSGNLNIPVDVQLWQNPQSADTITILCNGDNGESVAYYMSPANVTQGQSGNTTVMAFEQVTNTPGTEAVYGSEVMNNALFRPVDYGLVKSTANNYNLSHKVVTEDIANTWHDLRNKSLIVTAQLENRLYMLVNNALGDLLESGCRGNELWVMDAGGENPTWSRFTIQAHGLKVFTVGNRARLGVLRPDGIFYLDPYYRKDDVVLGQESSYVVVQQPIPWYFETNTQGANRAHDAWCNLQQVAPTLGNMTGKIRYGIKGHSVDGKRIEKEKIFSDKRPFEHEKATWDVQDMLLVRRNLMEWFFYAGSIDGEYSHGNISAVQYRYTPVSVNVGYEYGSIETFEYGRNAFQTVVDGYENSYGEYGTSGPSGPNVYSDNGIPNTYMDYTRP